MQIQSILHENVNSEIELDFYVPVTVEFKENDNPTKELLYFRMLNERFSFVEFKVNSESRKIYSIIVVSINEIEKSLDMEKTDFSNIPFEKGNPTIDIDFWRDTTVKTAKSNFITMYNTNDLFILPEDKTLVTKRILMSNLELLVNDEKEIIGIIFFGLPNENKKDFEDCIDRVIAVQDSNKMQYEAKNSN